jgi:hypothetical protein
MRLLGQLRTQQQRWRPVSDAKQLERISDWLSADMKACRQPKIHMQRNPRQVQQLRCPVCLLHLNLSSSGARATLPMYLSMVPAAILKGSSPPAFFIDTSCDRSFSITAGDSQHAAHSRRQHELGSQAQQPTCQAVCQAWTTGDQQCLH